MNERYKSGDEFLPFHPQASHVDPSYRDGWNACYRAAASLREEAQPTGWAQAEAIKAARAAGFAGTSWHMGPEELALLLTRAYPHPSLIEAADKHADAYEGQDIPARDVRTSITNAFYAGTRWRTAGVAGTSADERMWHDYPILQQFHTKHALGALSAPSCLCCGQQTHPITRPIAVQHMELPAIVVCKQCKEAAAGVGEVPRG